MLLHTRKEWSLDQTRLNRERSTEDRTKIITGGLTALRTVSSPRWSLGQDTSL